MYMYRLNCKGIEYHFLERKHNYITSMYEFD